MDQSRLVISNDGWELVKTDILVFHNYSHGEIEDYKKHEIYEKSLITAESIINSNPARRNIYAQGYKYEGEPILLTEFGGISFIVEKNKGWGYTNVADEKSFIQEYERLLSAINKSEVIAGFCYTQFTDVEQEVNGLLKYDRTPKADLEIIKKINQKVDFK